MLPLVSLGRKWAGKEWFFLVWLGGLDLPSLCMQLEEKRKMGGDVEENGESLRVVGRGRRGLKGRRVFEEGGREGDTLMYEEV